MLAAALSGLVMTASDTAAGQGMQAPPQQATPAAPPPSTPSPFPAQPPPAQPPPGFVFEFGRWWDSARSKFDDVTRQSNDAARDAATATQDVMKNAAEAATTIVRLPGARVIEIHERCALAPNGAPDCRKAAAKACRVKGFTDGHPVNVQSSENCPPAVWMSGHDPTPGECPEETIVLLAACD
jgi:hypothetical protein